MTKLNVSAYLGRQNFLLFRSTIQKTVLITF